jgi:hypothetical protein
MWKTIYVFVGWNKDRKRVEVHPGSIELTDQVDQVTWTSYGPEIQVTFEDPENRGPFFDLAASLALGVVRGYGNNGPRPPAGPDKYPYEVVLQTPDGPKTGSGLVINRATKAKRRKPPANPAQPSGPPDITLKENATKSGTKVVLSPQTFKIPKGKPFVVWKFSNVKPSGIAFPAAAGMPFEWVDLLPSNCVGVVGSRRLAPGSSFEYEVEVEGLAKPVKGVIRRA